MHDADTSSQQQKKIRRACSIATWGCCHPHKIPDFNEYIISNGWAPGGLRDSVEFTIDMMEDVRRYLGVNPQKDRTWFVIINQMPGDLVYIPAG